MWQKGVRIIMGAVKRDYQEAEKSTYELKMLLLTLIHAYGVDRVLEKTYKIAKELLNE